jgi:hypothetical protein
MVPAGASVRGTLLESKLSLAIVFTFGEGLAWDRALDVRCPMSDVRRLET